VKFGETTPDGKVSLIAARCVGSCGLAPVAVLDDQVAGKLAVESSVRRIEAWMTTSEEVQA
jgi:bidirectional [NiFe] hydrogenase diaphorase subunit